MIINETGTYKTLTKYFGGNLTSRWTIPEDTEFEVTQIDSVRHQFYSSMFGDWQFWDRAVIKIK